MKKARFSKGVHIKYRVYDDVEYTDTPLIKGTLSPEFKHNRIVSFPKVQDEHLKFFDSGCVTFLLYGVQEDSMTDNKLSKMTTKVRRIIKVEWNSNIR